MINVLFAALPERWDSYAAPLKTAFENQGLEIDLRMEFAPQDVDYIIYAPNSDLQDFTPYTRCKAVLNLWAGVETIVGNQTLTQPLCRMVDPGLTQAMVEWVTGHVMRYHLDIDYYLANQTQWTPKIQPLTQERRIAILGLGALGSACGQALATLGFHVMGWSRSPKEIANLACHSGEAGLKTVLSQADMVVLLLPDTPDTQNTLNAETLSYLPKGAKIINPGRGPLIDDSALLTALDSGQIGHATLDVFRIEPLPQDSPYWAHPNVTVTPHIAAETRALTASQVIAENIKCSETGKPLLNLVERERGY